MPGRAVYLVSLGCPKNRVDSEVLLGDLLRDGWEVVESPEHADLLVVNTCAFIREATEESIDTILELAAYRRAGRPRQLVVTGCAVQRYGSELAKELPEVDLLLGTGEYSHFAERVAALEAMPRIQLGGAGYLHDHTAPRARSTGPVSAYLKISEGCDHRCTYCIIPSLRGDLRSRSIPSLVLEAQDLVARGVRELNLVGQDTSAYGADLGDGTNLAALLTALAEIPDLAWLRVLYANPLGINDELLRCLAQQEKVCRYLDIPVQHASLAVLRRMGRRLPVAGMEALVAHIREQVPGIWLRTTLMVGFPGEDEDDFQQLLAFVKQMRFERLGIFLYSCEEGTAAARLVEQVPPKVAKARLVALQRAQRSVVRGIARSLVGQVVRVLVEGPSSESDWLLEGRLEGQAPDVDGKVYITNAPAGVQLDRLHEVRLVQSDGIDVIGEWIEDGRDEA